MVLATKGERRFVDSQDIIDPFLKGDYDNYEVTRISVENYGWLRIDLADKNSLW